MLIRTAKTLLILFVLLSPRFAQAQAMTVAAARADTGRALEVAAARTQAELLALQGECV